MGLTGSLKEFGLTDLFQVLGQQQKTGVLNLQGDEKAVQVFFDKGMIVKVEFPEETGEEIALGRRLIRGSLISAENWKRAYQQHEDNLVGLEKVLVGSGLVTKEDLGGIELTWGNLEAICALVKKSAFRDGMGDQLADGLKLAPDRIEQSLKRYAMTHKGAAITSYEPLPQALRERLQQAGKKPADPATVREIYEAMFRRIAASHPLDYFWIWTPEGWSWGGNKPEQYAATVADVRLAVEALKNSGATFRLATCGWVLGPQHDRAAFDNDLPKDITMSAISRQLGWTEVDRAYGRIQGREKWAIPWFESDGQHGLAALQPFVGRLRRDAADALAYGCTGLMGLQWRTDILAPNIAALAQASWNQTGWNPHPGRRPVDAVPTVEGPIGGNMKKTDE